MVAIEPSRFGMTAIESLVDEVAYCILTHISLLAGESVIALKS